MLSREWNRPRGGGFPLAQRSLPGARVRPLQLPPPTRTLPPRLPRSACPEQSLASDERPVDVRLQDFPGSVHPRGDVSAAMHDGDDVQALGTYQIHDPVPAVDEFPDIIALRFRHQATDLWIRAYVLNRVQDSPDKLPGVVRRVPCDVVANVSQVGLRVIRPANCHGPEARF